MGVNILFMIIVCVCSKHCNCTRGFDAAEMDTKTAITEGGKQLGYDQLRPKQIEAMSSFIEGNDVFVSLPTGYGKSIIYAALPYAFDKLKGKMHYC